MPKELIISVSLKETKAAILDNDQVVEIYIEREKEQSIVGSICKGRVTKVLPGMQSAFVDIGLERDAFLYVSDFFEDTEEYDKIVTSAEEQVAKLEQGIVKEATPAESETAPATEASPAGQPSKFVDRRGRTRRARRSRLRGKRFEEPATEPISKPVEAIAEPQFPSIILPGESLAKYQSPGAGELEIGAEEPEESESFVRETDLDKSLIDETESPLAETAFPLPGKSNPPKEGTIPSKPTPDFDSAESVSPVEILTPDEIVTPLTGAPAAFKEPRHSTLEATAGTEPLELEKKVLAVPPPAKRSESGTATEEEKPILGKREETSIKAEPLESSGEPSLAALRQDSREASISRTEPANLESLAELLESTPEPKHPITDTTPKSSRAPREEEIESVATPNPPEKESPNPVTPSSSRPNPSNKAEFRNPSGTSRFYRHGPENRRRPHNYRDRKENGASEGFPLIADLLKEGQEILVQVAKEPLGTKGARITSHIALPGRYLVYMPTVEHIGVSRKIDSDEERQRLKRIIQEQRGSLSGGFIVRTAGQGRGEEEFKSDIHYLSALWADIRAKAEKRPAPAVIHRDLNLVQRLLRDQLSPDFVAIRVDNEVEFTGVLEFVHRFMPSMVSRVKLYLKDNPIFEEFGVQAEIDKALRSKVWLKSGGYIVIDQAEALVAIDVNTGKYVGKSNKLEDTIVKTNLEAAKEIARQIRLRDLGGIIVCDFIDMEDRKNRQKVTQALEEALRGDKSPSKILQFNDFGLVAITRKRVKQSLLKILSEPCPGCNGSGMVKSPQTICYEIQSEVKKMARSLEDREITLRVNPAVAKALKTDEASIVAEIETIYKKEVVIKSDPLLQQEHFDIF